MLLAYSKIIGLPIADIQNEKNIGSVKEVFFNSDCAVVGFMIKSQSWGLADSHQIVPADAVVSLFRDGLSIGKEEDIVDMNEMVRLKGIIANRLFGLNQKVVTSSGQQIGMVYDYLIDAATLAIIKFYVRHLWSEKIILSSHIIGFETNKIIVKDDMNAVEALDPAPESVIATD